MTSRALAVLAAFASPVFMVAAVAGWLYEVWPPTPLTLGIAGFLVIGGPLVGIIHVATSDEDDDEEELMIAPVPMRRVVAPRPVAAPPRTALTMKAEAARQFMGWRDRPHPAIERREREARASQWIRASNR